VTRAGLRDDHQRLGGAIAERIHKGEWRMAKCGWLEGFPHFARDASLLEDALKQRLADVALMRIRQIHTRLAAFH
jgi:hypothetical protein